MIFLRDKGCIIRGSTEEVIQQVPHVVLSLVWQTLKLGLLFKVSEVKVITLFNIMKIG